MNDLASPDVPAPTTTWVRRAVRAIPVLLRSAGVGAVATLVDLATLTVLVSVLDVNARVASAPALLLGMGAQFVGNKLFAFRDHSKAWVRQGLAFFAVEALGLLANLALFDLALRYTPIPYLLARLLTTNVVYFAICLPLWSRIFAHGATAPGTPENLASPL